jgi:RimJ/RimL family protein N-acetyltransferase
MPRVHDLPPKLDISLATEKYQLRILKPDDASEKMASWFSDPHVVDMINVINTRWDRGTVIGYINQYDQRDNVLLGLFVRESGALIGIITLKINYTTRHALLSVLIGDAEYRNQGAWSDIHVPFYDYIFDKLRLKMILASALAKNKIIIDLMLRRGWKLDQTLHRNVRSNSDDTMLDLCLFSLTRQSYRNWKKATHGRSH